MRICTICHTGKPLSEFYKEPRTRLGYETRCKSCLKIYHKLRRTKNKEKEATHKKRWAESHPWWHSYAGAQQRCTNPNHKCYKFYGGRGIRLKMSLNDFKKLWFRDDAYLLKCPSIDRINNKKDYTIGNCRFVEMVENARNNRYRKEKVECRVNPTQ